MGGYIKRDVERVETAPLNTKVNKEVFDAFKDCCKEQGYPLNIMLETFMRQYANGKFKLDEEDILKFKNDGEEVSTLNTTFNKEIYLNFKSTCKFNGYFMKHVITAFMEQYVNRNLVLEYVDFSENKK
jgi:hypothetical protein